MLGVMKLGTYHETTIVNGFRNHQSQIPVESKFPTWVRRVIIWNVQKTHHCKYNNNYVNHQRTFFLWIRFIFFANINLLAVPHDTSIIQWKQPSLVQVPSSICSWILLFNSMCATVKTLYVVMPWHRFTRPPIATHSPSSFFTNYSTQLLPPASSTQQHPAAPSNTQQHPATPSKQHPAPHGKMRGLQRTQCTPQPPAPSSTQQHPASSTQQGHGTWSLSKLRIPASVSLDCGMLEATDVFK